MHVYVMSRAAGPAVLVGSGSVFKIWYAPDPVFIIWSAPDPVFKIWSDSDSV